MMKEERRLVWRVLHHWMEIAQGRPFPRRDEIEPWFLGEDGANCLPFPKVMFAPDSPLEEAGFEPSCG
jgi:hypothetical protein